MSAINPRFESGVYARLRAFQEVYGWASKLIDRLPDQASGLRHTAAWCRATMDRMDPDRSKRREMDADMRARGRA